MSSSAKKFIQSRLNPMALTQRRVEDIFAYVSYCYNILVSEKIQYGRKWIKQNSKDQVENYVKKKFVHNYLKKQKKHYPSRSAIEDILFECEPEMPYTYYDLEKQKDIEANDRIDIKINRLGLQDVWKDTDEQDIYLAIECKIINTLSDNVHYKNDIQKFADRKHLQFRLPIEGMIAFKETKAIPTATVVNDLNNRLTKCSTINTTQILSPLSSLQRSANFYSSKHKRNFDKKREFSISHIYLDYSNIIVP